MSIAKKVEILGQTMIDDIDIEKCRMAGLMLHHDPEWIGVYEYKGNEWYACTPEWYEVYKSKGGVWTYSD